MITCGHRTFVTKTRCGEPATRFFRVKIIDKIVYRFRCNLHKDLGILRQYELKEISKNEAIVAHVMKT